MPGRRSALTINTFLNVNVVPVDDKGEVNIIYIVTLLTTFDT